MRVPPAWLNHLPKSSPNVITLEIRISIYEFGEEDIHIQIIALMNPNRKVRLVLLGVMVGQ